MKIQLSNGVIYDNINNTLLNNGNFLYSPKQKEISEKEGISHLRIQLGTACNYKCSFCINSCLDKTKVASQKDIDNFLKLLINEPICNDVKIEFWGGEPLIYWKNISYLLPKLREYYPNCRYAMVTNGTLLDEKKIKVLSEYKVEILISHDAQAYFLRGPDPIENPKILNLWKEIFEEYYDKNIPISLNTVISPYNEDLWEVDAFFKKRLPFANYRFEGVVMPHTDKVFPKYSKKLFNSIFESCTEGNNSLAFALSPYINKCIDYLIHAYKCEENMARCDAHKKSSLSVDLFGNILTCHNVDLKDKIGELGNKILSKKCFKLWHERECVNCPVLVSCKGACLRLDIKHKQGCSQYAFHEAILLTSLSLLFNRKITFEV